jgi:hypothetical protein
MESGRANVRFPWPYSLENGPLQAALHTHQVHVANISLWKLTTVAPGPISSIRTVRGSQGLSRYLYGAAGPGDVLTELWTTGKGC